MIINFWLRPDSRTECQSEIAFINCLTLLGAFLCASMMDDAVIRFQSFLFLFLAIEL